MFSEDDLVQLSALQHYLFCPRQCALIHIEQLWGENRFTAEGRVLHERVDEQGNEVRGSIRIERAMAIRSLELGLIGKADVVEFHGDHKSKKWTPYPVEYKRGKPKPNDCDKVQLCAQALCLEEMCKCAVPEGSLYYGKTKHRLIVGLDRELRQKTYETAHRLHEFIDTGITPKAVYDDKCEACSLRDLCLPETLQRNQSVAEYLTEEIKEK